MNRFDEGDRVRVDIPDTSDPDYEQWHGSKGTIVEIAEDAAGIETAIHAIASAILSKLSVASACTFVGGIFDRCKMTDLQSKMVLDEHLLYQQRL